MFRRVTADVNAQTGGRQRPETYVSLLSNYYLNQTDRIAFDKIKETPDPAVLLDFVAKFPTSSYVPEAQTRIQRIEATIRERQNQEARSDACRNTHTLQARGRVSGNHLHGHCRARYHLVGDRVLNQADQ